VTPPGYEYVGPPSAANGATAAEDLEAGELCYLDADGWHLAIDDQAIAGTKLGFAAQDYDEGRKDCSILFQGEIDGFSGLTPGVPLFPSASTAGGLDTTVPTFYGAATTPAVAVPAMPRIWALSATSIYFDL
jgi:hypothetical protein